jgi:uncharacterized protein
MEPGAPPKRLTLFALLVLALSVPMWAAGASNSALLGRLVPIDLPVSALTAFVPMAAAIGLSWRDGGGRGAWRLLVSAIDLRQVHGLRWVVAAALLMPAMLGAEFALLWLAGRAPADAIFPVSALPVYFPIFFLAAIGEELGWQGYCLVGLRSRYGALQSALAIAALWVAWHAVPFLQTHRTPDWVFWQCIQAVFARIIIVWLCANAGDTVVLAVIFHMMSNVSEFMYPNYGSHYDPFLTAIFTAAVAIGAVALWGSATLRRSCAVGTLARGPQ